jgi:hypothetical protein
MLWLNNEKSRFPSEKRLFGVRQYEFISYGS